jgi:hypothetical protein
MSPCGLTMASRMAVRAGAGGARRSDRAAMGSAAPRVRLAVMERGFAPAAARPFGPVALDNVG